MAATTVTITKAAAATHDRHNLRDGHGRDERDDRYGHCCNRHYRFDGHDRYDRYDHHDRYELQ